MTVTRTTVVTGAAENRLLADPKILKLALNKSSAGDDEYIDWLNATESAAFEQACNRVFAIETVQDTFWVDHGPDHADTARTASLVLSRIPVVSVASVTECGTALDTTLYDLDQTNGILRRLHVTPSGYTRLTNWRRGEIVVVYSGGYVLPGEEGRNLPFDIERAVTTMMKAAYMAKDRDPAERAFTDPALGTVSRWLGIPPDVQKVIDSYTFQRIG